MKKSNLTLWQKFGMYFYRRRSLTAVLFLILAVFGIVSYTTLMRREGFPSVSLPFASVQVIAFGSSAESVDSDFTQPIIKAINESPNVKTLNANTSNQGASVVVGYKDGSDAKVELKNLEDLLKDKLPEYGKVVYIPVGANKFTIEGDDILVSVYAKTEQQVDLEAQAKQLATRIQEYGGLVKTSHVIRNTESVIDPKSGEEINQKISFDRFYSKELGRGVDSVLIGVQGVTDVDQLKLYDQVASSIEQYTKDGSISAQISSSFAPSVRDQVASLQKNLLEGLAVVLVVSFVLISLRASIATAVSMASTVLITVGVLNLIGYTLNTITLFSLVLCLALIVDDTTIMVEAIDAGLRKGKKYSEVVSESMRKVARASSTGTLTTMLAFAPMLFISGILGKFVHAIPVTIITSLAVSLLVSFIFIPLIVRLTYGKTVKHADRQLDIAGHLEENIAGKLSSILLWSDKNRKRRIYMRGGSIVIGMLFLVGGGLIFGKVGFNIFPTPKDGVELSINAQARNRESATLNTTEKYADEALGVVRDEVGKELESYTLGGQQQKVGRDGFGVGVELTPLSKRSISSVEIAEKLQASLNEKVPQMNFKVNTVGAGPPQSGFAVDIDGTDPQKAYALAKDLQTYMGSLTLKRINGTTASLKNVTDTPSVVIRRNQDKRIVSVSVDFSDKDTSTLVALSRDAITKEFSGEILESKYGLSKDAIDFNIGQEQDNQDSFSSMGAAAIPLFIVMIVVMGILFRSVFQPILILTALPFAIFGVANGLLWTHNEISFFTMLGVFALIGISLNNTILLTDYANQAKARGKKGAEAMADALRARFRPLLTTSLTSVFALLPLALHDPFWEGLAYALMFGLISSTILVILVFPYFYLVEESIANRLSSIFSRVVKKFIS